MAIMYGWAMCNTKFPAFILCCGKVFVRTLLCHTPGNPCTQVLNMTCAYTIANAHGMWKQTVSLKRVQTHTFPQQSPFQNIFDNPSMTEEVFHMLPKAAHHLKPLEVLVQIIWFAHLGECLKIPSNSHKNLELRQSLEQVWCLKKSLHLYIWAELP